MSVEVKVQCAKEVLELGQGISAFVVAVGTAVKNGWQFESDLPVVIQSALRDLVPAMQGVEKIKGEYEVSKKEVLFAVVLPIMDAVETLTGK